MGVFSMAFAPPAGAAPPLPPPVPPFPAVAGLPPIPRPVPPPPANPLAPGPLLPVELEHAATTVRLLAITMVMHLDEQRCFIRSSSCLLARPLDARGVPRPVTCAASAHETRVTPLVSAG